MHLLLGVALLAVPMIQDEPFCADIRRLSAAASEAKSFDGLVRSGFVPRLLAGCNRGADGFFCHQSMLPRAVTYQSMAARIASCLPDSRVTTGPEWPGLQRISVTGGGLVFDLEESGGERAHVGRILHIEIRARPDG